MSCSWRLLFELCETWFWDWNPSCRGRLQDVTANTLRCCTTANAASILITRAFLWSGVTLWRSVSVGLLYGESIAQLLFSCQCNFFWCQSSEIFCFIKKKKEQCFLYFFLHIKKQTLYLIIYSRFYQKIGWMACSFKGTLSGLVPSVWLPGLSRRVDVSTLTRTARTREQMSLHSIPSPLVKLIQMDFIYLPQWENKNCQEQEQCDDRQ